MWNIFKVNNKDTRAIVNFEHISHLVLAFSFLALNMQLPAESLEYLHLFRSIVKVVCKNVEQICFQYSVNTERMSQRVSFNSFMTEASVMKELSASMFNVLCIFTSLTYIFSFFSME